MIDLISRQTDPLPPPFPPPPRSFLTRCEGGHGRGEAIPSKCMAANPRKKEDFSRAPNQERTIGRLPFLRSRINFFLTSTHPPQMKSAPRFVRSVFSLFSCTCPRGGTEFSLFFPMTYPPALSSYVPRDSRHFFPSPFLRCTKGDRSDDVGARKSKKREA